MPEEGITLDSVDPQWMQDGLGVIGDQPDAPEEFVRDWDTNPWTEENKEPEDFSAAGANDCKPPSADTSKIYVKATHYVGGKWVCYWLDTTTCP